MDTNAVQYSPPLMQFLLGRAPIISVLGVYNGVEEFFHFELILLFRLAMILFFLLF